MNSRLLLPLCLLLLPACDRPEDKPAAATAPATAAKPPASSVSPAPAAPAPAPRPAAPAAPEVSTIPPEKLAAYKEGVDALHQAVEAFMQMPPEQQVETDFQALQLRHREMAKEQSVIIPGLTLAQRQEFSAAVMQRLRQSGMSLARHRIRSLSQRATQMKTKRPVAPAPVDPPPSDAPAPEPVPAPQ